VGGGWSCAIFGGLWWKMVTKKDGEAGRGLAIAATELNRVKGEKHGFWVGK